MALGQRRHVRHHVVKLAAHGEAALAVDQVAELRGIDRPDHNPLGFHFWMILLGLPHQEPQGEPLELRLVAADRLD